MPSLYKSNVVQGNAPRAVPLTDLTVKPTAVSPQVDESLLIVESRAEALFKMQWQQAQAELAAMKDKLLAEIAEERKAALEQSRKEGFQSGLNAAQAEAQKLMREIDKTYLQLEQDRQDYLRNCQGDIIDLVVSCTSTLLQQELNSAPEMISVLISKAIAELVSKQRVVVFVHPTRVDAVQSNAHLLPPSADGSSVCVRPDPTLNPYTFRVADDLGAVLIDLPTQLQQLQRVITNE